MSDDTERKGLGEYDEDELVFHPDGTITRKKFLIAGGAAIGASAGGPLLFTSADAAPWEKGGGLPYNAHTNVKGHITFWHFWSSPLRHGAIHQAIKQFNSHYKNVHVTDLPIPFGDIFDKLHAAVAAGKGMPDAMVADRPSFWVDARHKTYDPLTTFAARDKFNGSKIFWPFTWYESNVKVGGKNQLFGLPFETDIRVLFWNRAMFADAGLNPNKPPVHWTDIPKFAAKLDQKSGDRFNVMTYWPGINTDLPTYFWQNGTDVQDKKMHPTLNGAKQVQAANWVKQWADHDGDATGFRFVSSQNASGRDEFGSGHLAMLLDIPTRNDQMTQQGVVFRRKDGSADYPYWGEAVSPYFNSKGAKPYTFSGGFALGMPRNSHRSKATQDATWEFIKFMSLVGQLTFEQFVGNIPCVKSMMNNSYLNKKPYWGQVKKALQYGHPKTRNYYDPLFPGNVTDNAMTHILGGATPKSELDNAQAQAITNLRHGGMP